MKWSDSKLNPLKQLQSSKTELAASIGNSNYSKHLMKQNVFDKYKKLNVLTDKDLSWITLVD